MECGKRFPNEPLAHQNGLLDKRYLKDMKKDKNSSYFCRDFVAYGRCLNNGCHLKHSMPSNGETKKFIKENEEYLVDAFKKQGNSSKLNDDLIGYLFKKESKEPGFLTNQGIILGPKKTEASILEPLESKISGTKGPCFDIKSQGIHQGFSLKKDPPMITNGLESFNPYERKQNNKPNAFLTMQPFKMDQKAPWIGLPPPNPYVAFQKLPESNAIKYDPIHRIQNTILSVYPNKQVTSNFLPGNPMRFPNESRAVFAQGPKNGAKANTNFNNIESQFTLNDQANLNPQNPGIFPDSKFLVQNFQQHIKNLIDKESQEKKVEESNKASNIKASMTNNKNSSQQFSDKKDRESREDSREKQRESKPWRDSKMSYHSNQRHNHSSQRDRHQNKHNVRKSNWHNSQGDFHPRSDRNERHHKSSYLRRNNKPNEHPNHKNSSLAEQKPVSYSYDQPKPPGSFVSESSFSISKLVFQNQRANPIHSSSFHTPDSPAYISKRPHQSSFL